MQYNASKVNKKLHQIETTLSIRENTVLHHSGGGGGYLRLIGEYYELKSCTYIFKFTYF